MKGEYLWHSRGHHVNS